MECMGNSVLDFFAENSMYNLILAPHLKLFQEKNVKKLIKRYSNCSNIIIDVNSNALIDMTYTKFADVYIGDISSQGYEFLYNPRPCVFLNPFKNKMVKMWELGDVVTDMSNFANAIESCFANHLKYVDLQKEEFAKRFSITDFPAGDRAAKVIKDFLLNGG